MNHTAILSSFNKYTTFSFGDKKLTEADSAKFFVKADGTAVLQKRGDLTDSQITTIEKFIKTNYIDMYKTWKDFGGGEFYGK